MNSVRPPDSGPKRSASTSHSRGTRLPLGRVRGGRRLTRPVGPTTERRILATLRSAIGDAVKRGLLTHDHMAYVTLRKAEPRKVRPWTPEQFWGFHDALATGEPGSAAARMLPVVQVATGTGLRLRQLLGLRWQDLDLDAGLLTVRAGAADRAGDHVREAQDAQR